MTDQTDPKDPLTEIITPANWPKTFPKQEPKEIPDRMTIIDTISHETLGNRPVQIRRVSHFFLKNREQPVLERQVRLTQEWHKLDPVWLKSYKLVHIWNDEGRFLQRIPSAEQVLEASRRVIEYGYSPRTTQDAPPSDFLAGLEVLPQTANRVCISDSVSLWLKAREGTVTAYISIFPD